MSFSEYEEAAYNAELDDEQGLGGTAWLVASIAAWLVFLPMVGLATVLVWWPVFWLISVIY